jgi:DNA polymerase III alpha subunit (gram-positive type)
MKDLFGLTGMNVIPLGERHSQSFIKRAAAKPCRIQIFHGLCACILRTEVPGQLRSHHDGDPFHTLLYTLSHGIVVVFDVETTGLSPTANSFIDGMDDEEFP